MINFKRMTMGTKLMVSTTLLITVAIATISIVTDYKAQHITEQNAREIAKETAYHYANVIKAILEVPLDEARALGTVFEVSLNEEGFTLTREQVNLMLKYFLDHRPDFFSTGAAFEPNAFDSQDAKWVDAVGHDKTGRFIPFWYRNDKGDSALTALVDYETEQWYALPKRTKREVVMEPYLYSVQDKQVLMTSLIVPVLDNSNKFLGITWFDLALEQLQRQIGAMEISGFKNAYLTIYSAGGTVIAGGNQAELGKNIKKTTNRQALIDSVLKNEPFYIERESNKLGDIVMTYGAPVEIGHTGTRWIVAVNISADELRAESNHMVVLIRLIGLGTILLVIFTLFLLIRRMVRPLLQVNNVMKHLAQGELIEADINYTATDEIAELTDSAKKLQGAFKRTIEQAQAIAAGNYTLDVKLLSSHDQLGQALSEMIQTLRGVIAQVNAIAAGDYTQEVTLLSEHDQLGQALSHMTNTLREMTTQNAEQDWIKTGQTQLNDTLSGEQTLVQIAENAICFMTPYVDAQVGVFYLVQEDTQPSCLKMLASHAYMWRKNVANEFQIGEGLVGQAALEQKTIIITNAPDNYIIIRSGLGESQPRAILVMPFLYENRLKGIIELASFNLFTDRQIEFLNQVMITIGIAVNTAESRSRMQVLLRQSETQSEALQEQTDKLQTQQQELQQSNEELQSQSEELRTQQEELRQVNEELEERTNELEQQKADIQQKNVALVKNKAEMEKTQVALETKARELEFASQYKSDFLANMSHELRTPLNSLLILAQLLANNKTGNLTDKQVEYAQTINSAGSDLLSLINDILDLSKVEAGKMDVHIENLSVTHLVDMLTHQFRPLADKKGLAFHITVADDMPAVLQTDVQRLQQILKNLLSNAFKFTEKGQINLTMCRHPSGNETLAANTLENRQIAMSVTDTGIGIPKDKQHLIFQAFQQVDGSTNRRYAGTGLGLSISRQLARLLGGELSFESEEGQGSTFTLSLPNNSSVVPELKPTKLDDQVAAAHFSTSKPTQEAVAKTIASPQMETPAVQTAETMPTAIVDDRDTLQQGDNAILIVEDDPHFSSILMRIARERHFKCLLAEDGRTGLQLAAEYQPSAILLDVCLPQLDGWTVMERLKDNAQTRHIPVHFMSAQDQDRDAKRMGAIGYLLKPVTMDQLNEVLKKIEQFIAKTVKNLLVIVENQSHQQQLLGMVKEGNVQCTIARKPQEALEQLHKAQMDCILLDVGTEQQNGIQFLEQLQQEDNLSQIPVILYADRDLTASEEDRLRRCAETLTVKAVRTPERLLDEATLFLHQVEANLPPEQRQILQMVHDKETLLSYKKVLIVDDDMRNTFALVNVLEEKNMDLLVAENGKEALEILDQNPDTHIVLMDIMMPEMDGYEAIQKIRAQSRFAQLPIIALTAKAMKGDRAKCIEAGANDYISKPVDSDKLISLMRVWLYR